jgi:flagellar biogenesis protein FliO
LPTASSSHQPIFSRLAATDKFPLAHHSMHRTFICAALALLTATAATRSSADTALFAGPPPWRDNASVYLNLNQSAPATYAPAVDNMETPAKAATQQSSPMKAPLAPATPPVPDTSVRHAFHQAEASAVDQDSQRRLPPPTVTVASTPSESTHSTASRRLPSLAPQWESIGTTVSALGVVIGFFLICAYLLRRGTRKSSAALPRDVVCVLGRVPLAARNVAQLLRVGNKLVLVSLTPAGAETLTEVTDPAEVDRLVGLCHQSDPHSTTKAFEQVFRQLSLEPSHDGFLGKDALHFRGDGIRG